MFDQIYDVRTFYSYNKEGAMIYGMLVATELLNGYSVLEWIQHSDVSSSLVISAFKKEGSIADKVKKEKAMNWSRRIR